MIFENLSAPHSSAVATTNQSLVTLDLKPVLRFKMNTINRLFCQMIKLRNLAWAHTRLVSTSDTRLKKKIHWAELARKKKGTDKALEHFDDFYKSIFRLKWPSVRLALLCPHKYVAILNNYTDTTATEEMLTNLGAMDLKILLDVSSKNKDESSVETDLCDDTQESFELDRIIEDKFKSESEASLNCVYPQDTEDKCTTFLGNSDGETVEHDFKTSFYERDRIIYPGHHEGGSLQNFVPATKLKGMEDFVSESQYYSYYKSSTDVPIEVKKFYNLPYPERLKVYSFDRTDISLYPPPRRTSIGTYNYYLMDGASILPVLALDIQYGDKVLDMCAAPGGKSLAILQTMTASSLVCSDLSQSRVNRIHNTLSQFLYDYSENWNEVLSVRKMDGCTFEGSNVYDKILVDVPCTNDRLSLNVDDNNIFKQNRLKERLKLPETQASLLVNALRLVKPGGSVVYSTCSLSPVQNDGVVAMALRRLWEEQQLRFSVIDFTPALERTSHLFKYGKDIGLKFGHLVVPFLPSNFGPLYFCKIVKNVDVTEENLDS